MVLHVDYAIKYNESLMKEMHVIVCGWNPKELNSSYGNL